MQRRTGSSTPEGHLRLLALSWYWSLGFGLFHQVAHKVRGFLLLALLLIGLRCLLGPSGFAYLDQLPYRFAHMLLGDLPHYRRRLFRLHHWVDFEELFGFWYR